MVRDYAALIGPLRKRVAPIFFADVPAKATTYTQNVQRYNTR